MSRQGWMIGLALSGALCGCGGASAVATQETVPQAPPPQATPALLSLDGAWGVGIPFSYSEEDIRVASTDGDGTIHAFSDAARVDVHGDSYTWAADVPYEPFVGAQGFSDGWVFVTRDGTVWRSPTFTGALTASGQVPGRVVDTLVAENVIAAPAAGRIYLIESDGVPHPLAPPADGTVIDAAFVSRTHGIVLLPPGRPMLTRDGTAYTPIDIGARSAYAVWPYEGRFFVETGDGTFVVGDDGTATAWTDEIPDAATYLDEDARHAITLDLVRRMPAMFSDTFDARGRIVLDIQPPSFFDAGEIHAFTPPEGREGCSYRGFGARFVAACSAEEGHEMLYESDDGTTWRVTGGVRGDPNDDEFAYCTFARDGSAIVCGGACDGDEMPTDVPEGMRVACWEAGDSHTTMLVPEADSIESVHADMATFIRPGDEHTVVGLILRGGAFQGTPIPMPEGVVASQAHITTDGTVYVIAVRGEDDLVVAIGPVGSPPTVRDLPDGVVSVDFVDAQHGVAAGRNLGVAFTTEDGGTTWTPVTVPGFDGSIVPLRSGLQTSCVNAGCFIGGLVLGPRAWVDHVATLGSMRLLATETRISHDHESAHAPTHHYDHWRCNAGEASTRGAAAPAGEIFRIGHGWAGLTPPSGDDDLAHVLRWGGVDARGTFDATARTATISLHGDADDGGPAVMMVGATRRSALFIHDRDFTLASATGGTTELGSVLAHEGYRNHTTDIINAGWAIDDHTILVWATFDLPEENVSADRVFQVTDGAITHTRDYLWPMHACERMLAHEGTTAGLWVRCTGEDAPRLFPVDGTDPRPIANVPDESPALCGARASTTQVLAPFAEYVHYELMDGWAQGRVHAQLDFDAHGTACLRQLIEAPQFGEERNGAPIVTASRGHLSGAVTLHQGTRPLTCETVDEE